MTLSPLGSIGIPTVLGVGYLRGMGCTFMVCTSFTNGGTVNW